MPWTPRKKGRYTLSIRPFLNTVAAGGYHSLAVRADGTVWAWGNNVSGQLGDGSNESRNAAVQTRNLNGVTSVTAGEYHSLALKNDGTVWAWGDNEDGQLGDDTDTARTTPVQVSSLTGIVAIAAGNSHSLALKNDGTVWAWGMNSDGALGDGSLETRISPVPVKNLENIVAIAAGGFHSLALRDDGAIWAWGYNADGQLGDATQTNRLEACASPPSRMSRTSARGRITVLPCEPTARSGLGATIWTDNSGMARKPIASSQPEPKTFNMLSRWRSEPRTASP
ncbi:MAG: hypothetical protein HC933_06125 [Pleurocapsa sp. SU_196_0]|nr:hypothetical protein [Pleurocapsa sp. SU_196_0]